MGKRFKNLEAALEYLRAPGGSTDPNAAPPAAPAGSQLAEYVKFRTKAKQLNYTRKAESNPKSFNEVKILPFAETELDGIVLVDFSNRASLKMSDMGLDIATLNHMVGGNAQRMRGFEPAKATVTLISNTAAVSTASKITGRTYKKKANDSYTFPFGAGALADAYKGVKGEVLTKVAAKSSATVNLSVSFRPEVYR